MSSSSSNPYSVYGSQGNIGSPLGMGSLQNLNRSGSSLVQLSRAAVVANQSSLAPGSGNPSLMGFNSAVGGGRITPTSSGTAASVSGSFGGPSGFPGGGLGFGSSQPPQLSRPLGILQSNSNSMPSSAAVSGRNPLFNTRDNRGKIGESLSAFDPSEFPSLGSRENSSAPNPALARSNYVGMVKQPAMEASEFQMSNEDFPALPGLSGPAPGQSAPAAPVPSSMDDLSGAPGALPNQLGGQPQGVIGSTISSSDMILQSTQQGSSGLGEVPVPQQQLQQPRRGIQTSPSGLVTNIPTSMVTDQFGMIGLLTFIRAAETDPNLVSLALGADLTTLGLNLNSEVNLYPTFGGPWAETPCRPQDIDYHVPYEYLTNTTIRDKLAPVKLNRYKDDVLFYMFYTNVGDVLQLAAAAELYNRDWRYHKEDRVWITRAPGMPPSEKTAAYERGTYYFFDVNSWRKVPKEFHLAYDKLEDRPSLPTNLSGQHGGVPATPSSGGSPAPPMAGGPGGDRGGIGGGVGGNGPMGMGQQQGPNQMSPNMNSGPLQPPPGGL
jgi:CCR4-NOT transcription complex subunit 2